MKQQKNIHRKFCGPHTKYVLHSVLCILLLSTKTNTFAAETPNLAKPVIVTPESIAGIHTITTETLVAALTSDKPPLLIDARIKKDRDYGYIENSTSLPDIQTNCKSLKKITANKEQQLIFYCNGVQCGRSAVSIKVARSCGYQHLSWYKGGFAEWKEQGYQYEINRQQ